jgi:lactoylglutathione lyase
MTDKSPANTLDASALAISLTVKDLQKSLVWYRDVVGFSVVRNIERDGKLHGVSLQAGEARIAINQDDGARGWTRVKGEGFSFTLTTRQSVDTIATGIKDRGGALETEPADMPWGVRMFRLRDPDGYKLGISSPRPS